MISSRVVAGIRMRRVDLVRLAQRGPTWTARFSDGVSLALPAPLIGIEAIYTPPRLGSLFFHVDRARGGFPVNRTIRLRM
jgi:hypothetical protein